MLAPILLRTQRMPSATADEPELANGPTHPAQVEADAGALQGRRDPDAVCPLTFQVKSGPQ
jgi:hypothetical protein